MTLGNWNGLVGLYCYEKRTLNNLNPTVSNVPVATIGVFPEDDIYHPDNIHRDIIHKRLGKFMKASRHLTVMDP